jgi:hypothetical protein
MLMPHVPYLGDEIAIRLISGKSLADNQQPAIL